MTSQKPQLITHIDEIIIEPIDTPLLHKSSRLRLILERYGFLISESKDVMLIQDDEPTSYEEVLKSSNRDK